MKGGGTDGGRRKKYKAKSIDFFSFVKLQTEQLVLAQYKVFPAFVN